MHVVIVQEHVLPYRYRLFQLMSELLEEDGIRLTVATSSLVDLHGRVQDESAVDWARLVPVRYFPKYAKRAVIWQGIWRMIREPDLLILPQMTRYAMNLLALELRRLNRLPVALWGQGRNWTATGDVGRNAIADRLLRQIITRPDWWFAYTHDVVDLVAATGFPRNRITEVRNSTDTYSLRIAMDSLRGAGPAKDEHTCAFVGSLYPDKGLDFLLQAGDVIAQHLPDFRLIAVGGGQQLQWLREQSLLRDWLLVTGPLHGEEKAEAVRRARLLLMPSHIGLVAVDSFAMELPVVTRDVGFQSPEALYLVDNDNARVMPGGTNPDEYAAEVERILADRAYYEQLVAGCRQHAGLYSVEGMAERFAVGIRQALLAGIRR